MSAVYSNLNRFAVECQQQSSAARANIWINWHPGGAAASMWWQAFLLARSVPAAWGNPPASAFHAGVHCIPYPYTPLAATYPFWTATQHGSRCHKGVTLQPHKIWTCIGSPASKEAAVDGRSRSCQFYAQRSFICFQSGALHPTPPETGSLSF